MLIASPSLLPAGLDASALRSLFDALLPAKIFVLNE